MEIKLSQLATVLFDAEDLPLIEGYTWYLSSDSYAQGYVKGSGSRTQVLMHHLIIGKPPEGYVTDHINRNRLDNRRNNLRHITRSENNYNSNKSLFASSQIKGVSKDKQTGLWRACKMHPRTKKVHYLGSFILESEAAKAVDNFNLRCANE